MIYICIATPGEMKLLPYTIPQSVWDKAPRIVITGVGGSNVVRKLRGIAKEFNFHGDFVWNVGYCGAPQHLKPGTVVHIDKCRTYHPGVDFDEPAYALGCPSGRDYYAECLTAGDFVTDPASIPSDCVVDMELAYICALFPDRVSAVKVVSDNCNLKQYNETCSKK